MNDYIYKSSPFVASKFSNGIKVNKKISSFDELANFIGPNIDELLESMNFNNIRTDYMAYGEYNKASLTGNRNFIWPDDIIKGRWFNLLDIHILFHLFLEKFGINHSMIVIIPNDKEYKYYGTIETIYYDKGNMFSINYYSNNHFGLNKRFVSIEMDNDRRLSINEKIEESISNLKYYRYHTCTDLSYKIINSDTINEIILNHVGKPLSQRIFIDSIRTRYTKEDEPDINKAFILPSTKNRYGNTVALDNYPQDNLYNDFQMPWWFELVDIDLEKCKSWFE